MAGQRNAFPLRFSKEGLRVMVRDLARRERISQNELIEQAVEHELVARGQMLAEDLARSAAELREMARDQHAQLMQRSISTFARGERRHDPLSATKIEATAPPGAGRARPDAVAAFRSAVD